MKLVPKILLMFFMLGVVYICLPQKVLVVKKNCYFLLLNIFNWNNSDNCWYVPDSVKLKRPIQCPLFNGFFHLTSTLCLSIYSHEPFLKCEGSGMHLNFFGQYIFLIYWLDSLITISIQYRYLGCIFTKPCHNAPLLAAGMDGIKCS